MSAPAREDAVAYLLDELQGPERRAFESRLGSDPRLRAEVEALRPVIGRLDRLGAGAWDTPDPPPAPPVPVTAPPALRARGPRYTVPAWGLAVAACTLIGLGAVAGGLLRGSGESTGTGNRIVVTLRPVDGRLGASGVVSFGRDDAVVRVEGLARAAASDHYELWLLTSPTDLVSLGSFRVPATGTVELRVPLPGDPRAFRYVDVSLEPGDGDPRHSQHSVLRAPTPS